MTIDWEHFTPWASLIGGLLIGLAAALFVLVGGRIAGISGIGWGLAGFCPGPTIIAAGMGIQKAIVFVVAMVAGMRLFN
jgi:uncharacterized membrane protein YedE/YeeE